MSAHDELGLGVPLVVCYVVVSLQPNPLLSFGQEAIVAGLALSKLHYCGDETENFMFTQMMRIRRRIKR